jgi:hypothetical protein
MPDFIFKLEDMNTFTMRDKSQDVQAYVFLVKVNEPQYGPIYGVRQPVVSGMKATFGSDALGFLTSDLTGEAVPWELGVSVSDDLSDDIVVSFSAVNVHGIKTANCRPYS